jgi:hypothetical protein
MPVPTSLSPTGPALVPKLPPPWLMAVGSLVIVFHLLTLGVRVLAAPSGPWPAPPPDGAMPMPPPAFAGTLHNWTGAYYLPAVKLTHDYHFTTNHTGGTGIYLEARLTDRDGKEVTLKLPDDGANPWVRHRQTLLAAQLGEDVSEVIQGAPKVAAEGQEVPTRWIWERSEKNQNEMRLIKEKEQNLSRVAPTIQPNPEALVLANAYARYLCRVYGADKVELRRYHAERIPPFLMDSPEQPMPGAFSTQVSYFGELPR